MIMVTHRLGVIRSLHVNRVLVLEQGEIVESGHPEDLLRIDNGHYASLAREQGITFAQLDTYRIDRYMHHPPTTNETTSSTDIQ